MAGVVHAVQQQRASAPGGRGGGGGGAGGGGVARGGGGGGGPAQSPTQNIVSSPFLSQSEPSRRFRSIERELQERHMPKTWDVLGGGGEGGGGEGGDGGPAYANACLLERACSHSRRRSIDIALIIAIDQDASLHGLARS